MRISDSTNTLSCQIGLVVFMAVQQLQAPGRLAAMSTSKALTLFLDQVLSSQVLGR